MPRSGQKGKRMAKRQPKAPAPPAAAPPPAEDLRNQAGEQITGSDEVPGEAPAPTPPLVLIGDKVFTVDRSRFLSQKERGIDPDPVPAIVVSIGRDKSGARTGSLGLIVFDPSGPQVANDVPYAATLTPNHWTEDKVQREVTRVRVPMEDLIEATKAALEQLGVRKMIEDATAAAAQQPREATAGNESGSDAQA